MNKKNDISDLLSALSNNLSTEDLRFADIASGLASQITSRRIELGLTQKEFAEKIGKSQAMISKWENADCNFQIKTLIEISQNLELPLTIAFKQPDTRTYFISPALSVTAATLNKYFGAQSPTINWVVENEH